MFNIIADVDKIKQLKNKDNNFLKLFITDKDDFKKEY